MGNEVCNHVNNRTFPLLSIVLLTMVFSPLITNAQIQTTGEETNVCKIKAGDKIYQVTADATGYFEQVSGFQPRAIVPIEVTYAQGQPGQKILLSAEDGGSFDNKKQVFVAQLNNERKCVFNFHLTSNTGLFEITLRKESDTKVVQLWVDEKVTSNQNPETN